jgi:hypothetical protein
MLWASGGRRRIHRVHLVRGQPRNIARRLSRSASFQPTRRRGLLLEGSPGEEIVKVVEANGADLLVVGSNRHSSMHNLFLGSTAAYLATHSPAPVLVMRANVSSMPASPREAPGAGEQVSEALPMEVRRS